jgi:hypothetical protein
MKEAFFLQLREIVCAIDTTHTTLIKLCRASPVAILIGRSGSCSYKQDNPLHSFRRDDACQECA